MSAVTFTSEDPLGALTVDNPPLNLVSHETMGAPENAIIAAATHLGVLHAAIDTHRQALSA
ncbi:hypothetical protein ACWD4L_03420 [Streptomyces sp. NPDC002596]|uniref:hypothetical protein n=1 Tax=unclassified Streptomyces TaxID=2593676 RepID=UPI0035D9D8FF